MVTLWYWVMSCSTRQVIIGLLPIQTKKVSALAQHRKCMKMHEHALQHTAHIGSLHSSWSSLICWSSSGIPVSVQTSETPLGGGNFTTRLNLSMWNKSIVLPAMAWCLMIRVPVFCFARLCYIQLIIVICYYMLHVIYIYTYIHIYTGGIIHGIDTCKPCPFFPLTGTNEAGQPWIAPSSTRVYVRRWSFVVTD